MLHVFSQMTCVHLKPLMAIGWCSTAVLAAIGSSASCRRVLQASVASYNDKLDRLNGDDEARTSIVERLKTFDDQLEAIKAEEQQARDKLTALQQKEEKKYEDIPALKEVHTFAVELPCHTYNGRRSSQEVVVLLTFE